MGFGRNWIGAGPRRRSPAGRMRRPSSARAEPSHQGRIRQVFLHVLPTEYARCEPPVSTVKGTRAGSLTARVSPYGYVSTAPTGGLPTSARGTSIVSVPLAKLPVILL